MIANNLVAWNELLEQNCRSIENQILARSFKNKNLLKRSLLRRAAYIDKDFPTELKYIGYQNGLDTFGDKVLDFAIFDHFMDKFLDGYALEKTVNGHREWFSQNVILQDYCLNCIQLHEYIVWGRDEYTREIWNQPTTKILADCFEALIGAIYKEQGMNGVKKTLEKNNFFNRIEELRLKGGRRKSDFHIL